MKSFSVHFRASTGGVGIARVELGEKYWTRAEVLCMDRIRARFRSEPFAPSRQIVSPVVRSGGVRRSGREES